MHALQLHREAAGLSKAELGRRAGCTGQMVGRIESGQDRPGVELAVRLAEGLDIPVVEIFPELAPLIERLQRQPS